MSNSAKASHALPIVGLTGVTGPTGVTISGSSDPATCVGTTNLPYWIQVEVTCDPNGFSGAAPISSSPLWGNAPWYHATLNIPGPPYNDQCVLEPYNNVFIPFSQLCNGTTYYWRAREFVEATNSVAAWMGPFNFVTPGSPPVTTLTATSNAYTVCPGTNVQLNANVSGGCAAITPVYSWLPTTGLNNPNIANPIATITGPITYTVTATGGCFTITSADDTVQITMGPNVAPGIATATPFTVCSGQSSQIVLTGTGANPIQWQVSPNGLTWFNLAGQINDTLNTGPLSSTLYYQAIVTGTGWPGSGCGTATSPPVQVTVSAAPIANAGINQTICNGSCATLTGTGGVSYDWQPGSLNSASVSVCPVSSTTYTLTVTDSQGCTATDNITVTTSTASVSASPNVNICTGNSTVLFASGPNGNTYNWTPSGTLVGANTANPSATPLTTTTYTVTATNTFGCTAIDSVVVTVTPAQPLVVSNDTTLCAGGSATITASGAISYNWMPGNISGASITVNPSSTVTYTVTGNNGNCLSVDSVTVNINAAPFVFAGPDFGVCLGSQATMNVSTTGTSYLWTPTTGIIGSNTTQSIVAAPLTNTSYTVTVTGPGGCISTDTINVAVNAVPNVTTTSPDASICAGLGTTVIGQGAATYAWIPTTNLGTPNAQSSSANPPSTTTYQVVGTDLNGCTDTASITITVNPLPAVYLSSTPTQCGDSTGALVNLGVVAGTGPFTYTVGTNPPSQSLPTNLLAGTYNVVTLDANGCISSQTVTVGMVNTAFVSAAANPTFGVYPLPVGFASSGSPGLNNWNWNFGDGLGFANTQSANYTYIAPGTYQVVITAWNDWFGCAVYDTIEVIVVDEAIVNLPNVFTPNGDLTNDDFSASISGVKEMKVEIFNRWGNAVYENSLTGLASSTQILPLWDGKSGSGKVADDGVYYYVITALGYDNKDYDFHGFVHLIKSEK